MLLKYITEDLRKFVNFSFILYGQNPYWTPPIIEEEIDTLDQQKTQSSKMQKLIIFWLLKMVKSQVELQ